MFVKFRGPTPHFAHSSSWSDKYPQLTIRYCVLADSDAYLALCLLVVVGDKDGKGFSTGRFLFYGWMTLIFFLFARPLCIFIYSPNDFLTGASPSSVINFRIKKSQS